jgi:hypothetical protein
MCSIKIGKKRTEFFNQRRGLRQGCNLSPALFNIYINELATILEKSSVPDVSTFQKLNAYTSQMTNACCHPDLRELDQSSQLVQNI